MSDSINLMNYQITSSFPSIGFNEQTIVNTINPHSYVVAERDEDFKKALQDSDYLLPDGIGIVYAAKLVHNTEISRISGPDFHDQLLTKLNKREKSCFYLGSSEETLAKIEQRLSDEYPNLDYGTYSPPFKDRFSDEDNREMIEKVNAFRPDVLFVGMTAPKQEKWVYQHKDKINAKVICSIGAAFDFFARTVKRSPDWMRNVGLEWLYRSLKTPSRLGKRNMRSNPEFVWNVLKAKFTN